MDIVDAIDDVHDADKAIDRFDGIIDTYKALKKVNAGNGLEVHHIIEKRFSKSLFVKENDMFSIALDSVDHRMFTNAWRKELQYGKEYSTDEIWEAAQKIYADYPKLLEAARKTLGK